MENTNIPRKVKRGEIYLYDFGANPESIQNGVRPVLVVQCDEGNEASKTTIIAAMTTVIKKCKSLRERTTSICTTIIFALTLAKRTSLQSSIAM